MAKYTVETLNEMINAVMAVPDKAQDLYDIYPLVDNGFLTFDSIKLCPDDETSDHKIMGIVLVGDENKALLVWSPPPLRNLYICYHPYKDEARCAHITVDELMVKIQQAIAQCGQTIEKIKECMRIEAPERRSGQREHITALMHHLAEIRTLSMMGKLELSDEMISNIASLNHKLSNILEAYSKGQTLEPPEIEKQ
jgi:hypothetical protein